MNERSLSLLLTHLPAHVSGAAAFSEKLAACARLPETLEVQEILRQTTQLSGSQVRDLLAAAARQAGASERFLDAQPAVRIFHLWSENYPDRLKKIPSPPWVLFAKGELPNSFLVPHLGVVGTRRPNAYGLEAVHRLIAELKTFPLRVVSGLALGIDSAAHAAANRAGFPNVAVLGNGIARVYPSSNQRLAEEILEKGGCLLSEYPPLMPAYPVNFPRRNRIISGLSDVVFVVQGAEKSGTVHTVKFALDQARTVCALPGDIFSELSAMPHRLMRDGAFPITRADDLDGLLQQRNPLF